MFSLFVDAVIERDMPMTAASMFWSDALHDCRLDRPLALPYDRYRLANEHRTGRLTTMSFNFGRDLSQKFLAYASTNSLRLQHLALTCSYVFLSKLTNTEKDLCIGMNIDNRYKDEFRSIIGLFENIVALRCQFDYHWSFRRLVEYVQGIMQDYLEYSYFPLQRVRAQHPNTSKFAFLDTMFDFQSNETSVTDLIIGPNRLYEHEKSNQSDFALIFQHERNTQEFSCTITASLDLFDPATIEKISHRFHSMLHQLFNVIDVEIEKAIFTLPLILPDENSLMQSINNTQVPFASTSCIHQVFVDQVMVHPQKLAVELDEQSLTYSELLHFAQICSFNLLDEQGITTGDVICQCVERSISMVSSSEESLSSTCIEYFHFSGNRHDGH